MPSSKLSGRRATAKKPPLCLSKPPPPPIFPSTIHVHIAWTDMLATPPNLFIDQTVTLDQDPAHKEVYTYTKADAGPNELANVEVNAPFDTTYNLINIQGNDDGGASHEADALFEPSRPPPFSQEVELFSYDYPEPGSVIAQISP